MNQQCALMAGMANVSWVHWEVRGQQLKGGDPPLLLGPSEATSGVLSSVLGFSVQRGQATNEESPVEAMKMVKGMEHLLCEKRL